MMSCRDVGTGIYDVEANLPMQDNTEGEFLLQQLWTLSAGSYSLPSGLFSI